MQYTFYSDTEQASYPVCLLVQTINRDSIKKEYIDATNLDKDDLLVMNIHTAPGKKKTPMSEIKQYIQEELVPVLTDMKVEYLLVTDSDYFKALTKAVKVEANLGYVMDSVFGDFKVIYIPNYRAIFYDPEKIRSKIAIGMDALHQHRQGSYSDPGISIIQTGLYLQTDEEIEEWLLKFIAESTDLTADIEAFSLKHYDSGIGTITFCWNQGEGISFPVDYMPYDRLNPFACDADGNFGYQVRNEKRRALLRRFFELHTGKLIWHNIAFDVYVLIYQLFMQHILDTEGLLYGIDVMLKNWHCTKLITYLATNSCAGNKLGLKDQAQEYAGNYAVEEIKDIRKIPLPTLLQYNLVDGLATWFVFDKHYQTMLDDDQNGIYEELFKLTTVDIIQMQLTGMPVNMQTVIEVKDELLADEAKALNVIRNSPIVQEYTYILHEKWVEKRNSELKKKRVTIADSKEEFNPNSSPQLQDLLFNFLQLPILGYTEAKQPSTDGDTIKALQKHTDHPEIIAFLKALQDYKAVNKIITDFIPSLEGAQQGPDGWHYLFGNFNLGGTKSGRLSSSKPNLQNLPASSKYAKLIKRCFEAPPGWLFLGLDFSSLEDRISALTTKDPMKLKVYTDGYDGHSLRAYAYFSDQMPDIDPSSVVSINSIEKKYKPLRQESKAPTFALTYQGTFKTLMTNCGFTEELAKKIEVSYHELYVVSDQWVADKLDEASRVGYVTVAFGLRLRTPLLKQVVRGNSKTPFEAEAEGRTAGNALGQSYCLLNSRAWVEFMQKVRQSKYRLDIRPCAQIHDAGYALVRDDIVIVSYMNEHLVKAVQWQEDPAIQHDEVKLGGELSIFHPTWEKEIVIPNGKQGDEIYEVIEAHMKKLEQAA